MKMLRRALLAALALAPFALANPAAAQMTPEGTKISNVATVDYEDENGTEYPTVADTVEVTVGYLAVVDVTGPGTLTPNSPTTGNTASFTLENKGNGKDFFNVTGVVAGTGISITGYSYEGNPYATLALLNAAILADDSTAAGGSITVGVVYSVEENQGGESIDITLTARSHRDAAETDNDVATIQPPDQDGVEVTPDNQAITRFPGTHTETFTVTNDGSDSDTFTLGTSPGPGITIVSVTGTGISGGSVPLDAGESVTVSVEYKIDFTIAAGGTTGIVLTATSADDGNVDDTGDYDITITRPSVAMSKGAYKHDAVNDAADETDPITTGEEVLPGEVIWYKLAVTNNGDQEADGVVVTDVLPSQVTYVSTSADAVGWSISYNAGTGTVTGTLTGSLADGASRYFWIKVTVK